MSLRALGCSTRRGGSTPKETFLYVWQVGDSLSTHARKFCNGVCVEERPWDAVSYLSHVVYDEVNSMMVGQYFRTGLEFCRTSSNSGSVASRKNHGEKVRRGLHGRYTLTTMLAKCCSPCIGSELSESLGKGASFELAQKRAIYNVTNLDTFAAFMDQTLEDHPAC